jgi:hypothetical protein
LDSWSNVVATPIASCLSALGALQIQVSSLLFFNGGTALFNIFALSLSEPRLLPTRLGSQVDALVKRQPLGHARLAPANPCLAPMLRTA